MKNMQSIAFSTDSVVTHSCCRSCWTTIYSSAFCTVLSPRAEVWATLANPVWELSIFPDFARQPG